jgi:flavin-dependent dehydrogenase
VRRCDGQVDRYDVVVVGAGPAGAAAGRALAAGGLTVAVVGLPAARQPRIGETLPGAVIEPLARLGVWESFLADAHADAPGNVVCWGSDEPYETDAIVDPFGPGWHLDRARFDAALLAAAGAAGARVVTSRVSRCTRTDVWSVGLAEPGAPALEATWVIDASGRAAAVARAQGAERLRADRLIGLARFSAGSTGSDPRTVIEACETGWWYAAVLPHGRAVAVLFTDSDLVPGGRAQRERVWTELFGRTRLVRGHLAGCSAPSPLRAADAASGELVPAAGEGWLAIGDAAQSWDPLSGRGVTRALTSAVAAADLLLGPDGDLRSAMAGYARRAREEYRAYLARRATHYGREQRWPDSVFWRRRRSAEMVDDRTALAAVSPRLPGEGRDRGRPRRGPSHPPPAAER